MQIWQRNSYAENTSYPALEFTSHRNRIRKNQADMTVATRSQLEMAVSTPGATVWIPEHVQIDMTGAFRIPIARDVTIASNRNLDGGAGGLIKTDGYDNGLFIHDEGSFRVTGLRVKGPRTDYFDPWDTGDDIYSYAAQAFHLNGQIAIIDNCEMFGWTFAAITVGSRERATWGWIHHNSLHHNQMDHLGYPMDLYNGLHLIEWNTFDANRHSIAGFGRPNNGYEARFNHVGPNAVSWSFDMHNLAENLPSLTFSDNKVGGKFTNVHHNVFELTQYPAFSIQGHPTMYSRFANNWCASSKDDAVYFLTRMRMNGNEFGPEAVKKGRERLREIANEIGEQGGQNSGPPKPRPTGMSQL